MRLKARVFHAKPYVGAELASMQGSRGSGESALSTERQNDSTHARKSQYPFCLSVLTSFLASGAHRYGSDHHQYCYSPPQVIVERRKAKKEISKENSIEYGTS